MHGHALHLLERGHGTGARIQLLATDQVLEAAQEASRLLASAHGIVVGLWRVTRYTDLVREACDVDDADGDARASCGLGHMLLESEGPVLMVMAGDGLTPDMLRAFASPARPFFTLAATASSIDAACVVQAVLQAVGPSDDARQLIAMACI